MRTLVRSLNILIAVLASCVLGLALYGVLRPPVAAGAAHPEALESHDEETPGVEDLTGDPWQRGTWLAEQGDWETAVECLEGALERSPETPERYLLLAQAYRETERDDDAAEVLRRGVEVTGAEAMALPLKAVESTLELPADQRACLDALCEAFLAEDAAFSTALEDFENGRTALDPEGKHMQNTLWVKTGSLVWDGERFWSDYSGVGLLFYGDGIFYGEISGNVPDGAGSCVTVHTWYPDSGAVGYLRLDGQWENGVAVGEAAFHDRCTNAVNTFSECDMTATLDGTEAEVIAYGEVAMRLPVNGTVHTFQLTIHNGVLDRAAFSDGVVPCSAHAGCRATLSAVEDSFSKTYQNPYPWGKESPYEDPWAFLNFSYGY